MEDPVRDAAAGAKQPVAAPWRRATRPATARPSRRPAVAWTLPSPMLRTPARDDADPARPGGLTSPSSVRRCSCSCAASGSRPMSAHPLRDVRPGPVAGEPCVPRAVRRSTRYFTQERPALRGRRARPLKSDEVSLSRDSANFGRTAPGRRPEVLAQVTGHDFRGETWRSTSRVSTTRR